METDAFYAEFLAPVIEEVGPFDRDTIVPIVGFDAGGPLSLCSVGRDRGEPFVTYVTCELALKAEQRPSRQGRYELMLMCDDEDWARTLLTNVGRMSLEAEFGHGHTLDIGAWGEPSSLIQGVAFELFASPHVGPEEYAIFRLHGLSRDDLAEAQEKGVDRLLARRRFDRSYPRIAVRRAAGAKPPPAPS